MIITLPSGLAGEVRGLTGAEAQAFADPSQQRGGGSVENMLAKCFLTVTDPGPYPFPVGAKPNWRKVLTADRFAALIDIRVASWGPMYEFAVQCSAQGCKERYDWELSLTDLPRKAVPEASLAKLRDNDNRFTVVAPNGEDLVYRLAVGDDEALMDKLRRQNRNVWGPVDAIAVVTMQLGTTSNAAKIRAYLEGLEVQPLFQLLDDIQANDGGIQTTIETECQFCRWVQEIQLPFGETFYRPRRRRKDTGDQPATTTTDPSR